MLRKLLSATFVLLFSVGMLLARDKAIPLNKLRQTDLGNPVITGSAKILKDGIQIVAGGADIWGVSDQFHFSWIEKTGDFDLAARVESLTATHMYTKAGLMVREELTDNSRHIFFQLFPDNKPRNKNNGGFEFQYRAAKGGEMKAIYPAKADALPEFPVSFPNSWIRLKRTGNACTGFCSQDGKTWKAYTTYSLDLPKKIFLGVAVTSHNPKESATAVFRNLIFK